MQVEIDTRELTGGEKAWSWVKKGVPIRLEIGNKECAANTVFMGRRDREYKDRRVIARETFLATVTNELDELQNTLLERATAFQKANTVDIHNKDDFYAFFAGEGSGFVRAHWNGSAEVEAKIKQDLSVTIRCIPMNANKEAGKCIFTGEPSAQPVIFAKAY